MSVSTIEVSEVPAFAIALAATRENTSPMEAWEHFGYFSDTYKDVNGWRPRSAFLIPKTMDDMDKEIASLIETERRNAMTERERYEADKLKLAELLKPAPPTSIGDLFPEL